MENKIRATLWSRTNKIVYTIFTSGLQDPANIELRGKIIFFNILIFIGVTILLPFGISRLFISQWLLGLIDLLTAAILVAVLVFHRITGRLMLSSIIGLSIMALLYGYLTISTGDHDTGFLWSYCLPLDVVLLLDRKRGSIAMLIYLIIMLICFIIPVFPAYYDYSANFKICYIISLMTVWVIAFYFEYLMSTLQHEVVKNNIQLQHTIHELGETKDQLFQAQKMEAIGRLAGGVAHDFNNILAGISGYADLIQQKFGSHDPKLDKYSASILNSAKRAADLTAKLLAYARKGKIEMAVVDMHQIIEDVIDICKHTMNKNVMICKRLNAAAATVMGDRNQIHNALTNLAVNAVDAMPGGGELSFATEIADVTEELLGKPGYTMVPGRYCKCTVADTGAGMDEHTLAKAFEPFFTTKEKGKGTGLGLSSVYGTIKSHNGYVELKSKPGSGTRVEIYLPLISTVAQKADDASRAVSRGRGMILLVDDEEMIRAMASEMLAALGYSVVVSSDGQDALEYYKNHARKIDLVVLDIVMPRLGGFDCFMAMKAINPKIRALAFSGYVINDEVKRMLAEGARGFLHKPFDMKSLSTAIQNALD